MSQNDTEEWAHFNIRCEKKLRDTAEAFAKKESLSLAAWVRIAIQEKIDRYSIQTPDASDLQSMVDASVQKALLNLGITSGVIHGISIADSNGLGFEKEELRAQRRY